MTLALILATVFFAGQQPQQPQQSAPAPSPGRVESQARPADQPGRPGEQAGRPGEAARPPAAPVVDEKPVVTRHEIDAGGKSLKYTVTTGFMPIKNPAGETYEFTHDEAGRVIQEKTFDGRVIRYAYSTAGRVALPARPTSSRISTARRRAPASAGGRRRGTPSSGDKRPPRVRQ